MRSEELADEIAELEPERDRLLERLDSLIIAYRPHLATVAEEWIRHEVESCIRSHATQIADMGTERVKELKSRVEQLISSLGQIVQSETSHKNDWPHNRRKEGNTYRKATDEPFFQESFRNVISHIGSVLNDFELLGVPEGHAETWKRVGPKHFQYAFNPGFERLTCETLNQYSEALKEYRSLMSTMEKKKTEMAEAKAKEIYDSA